MILNIHQKSRIIENEKIPWDTIVNQVLLSLQSNFGGDPGDLGIHRSKHAKNLGLDTLTAGFLARVELKYQLQQGAKLNYWVAMAWLQRA